MKKLIATLMTVGVFAFAATTGAAPTAPNSVIQVVTVRFKADAKPAQIRAAPDGVPALPAKYKGSTRTGSPAPKEWYRSYLPIRDERARLRLN